MNSRDSHSQDKQVTSKSTKPEVSEQKKKNYKTFFFFSVNSLFEHLSYLLLSRKTLFVKSTRVHGQRSQRHQNTTKRGATELNGGPTCHQNKRRRRQRQPDAHNTTRHGGEEDAGAKVHLRESIGTRQPSSNVPRMARAIRPRNDHPNGSEDAHKKGYLIPKHQRSNGKRRTAPTHTRRYARCSRTT